MMNRVQEANKNNISKTIDIILAEVNLLKLEVAFYKGEYLNNSMSAHLFEMSECVRKLDQLKQ